MNSSLQICYYQGADQRLWSPRLLVSSGSRKIPVYVNALGIRVSTARTVVEYAYSTARRSTYMQLIRKIRRWGVLSAQFALCRYAPGPESDAESEVIPCDITIVLRYYHCVAILLLLCHR